MVKKKFLAVFVSFVSCFVVCSSSVFARVYTTASHNPLLSLRDDLFARQPDGSQWCMLTCAKIVLRDIRDKMAQNRVAGANFVKLNDFVNGGTAPANPELEQYMMEELFRSGRAELRKTSFLGLEKSVKVEFAGVVNSFFVTQGLRDYAQIERGDIAGTYCSVRLNKKLDIFNGLIATSPDVRGLWLGDRHRMLMHSFAGVSGWAVCNLMGEMCGVGSRAQSIEKESDIDIIRDQIKGNCMVIVVFRNSTGTGDVAHACVAYRVGKTGCVYVYNPWGNLFVFKNLTVSIAEGQPVSWVADRYYTFAY